MKFYQLITIFSLLIFSAGAMAENCNQECWQKRYYDLQKQQIENQQQQFEATMKEKEILRKEKEKQEKAEKRQKLLTEIHERCAKEDMNKATFEEKSLCSAVNGHFTYGTEVSDQMLGLE